jgi:hypothetical protein
MHFEGRAHLELVLQQLLILCSRILLLGRSLLQLGGHLKLVLQGTLAHLLHVGIEARAAVGIARQT